MALKDWKRKRKYGLNWANGRTIILNINAKYKINTIVGYKVTLYDLSKGSNLNLIGRELKVLKTKAKAISYAKAYMKKH